MSRPSKPWYWKRRKAWYCTINGERIPLGPEKEAAFKTFYAHMARSKSLPVSVEESSGPLSELVDEFLEYVNTNLEPDTYRWYRDRLQHFCRRYPDLTIVELKPLHVQKWLDEMPHKSGTKRNYARSIVRCMNWAEEQGYIARSPLTKFKKPKAGVGQMVITPEKYQEILRDLRNPEFHDLLSFSWESGARAIECFAVEARHVENDRIVFPVEEEKMERVARIIYLTPIATEIVHRLASKYPNGPIFRNTAGKPWTAESVNCAFVALQIRQGLQAIREWSPTEKEIQTKMSQLRQTFKNGKKKSLTDLRDEARKKIRNAEAKKHAKKYCLTAFRHSYCNRLLKAGIDALTVSNLMGHSGISTLVKHYAKLNHARDYLKESLLRA